MTPGLEIKVAIQEARKALETARGAAEHSETACIGVAELRREMADLKRTVKVGNVWTGGIVALGVALIGAISQVQVARIGADATARGKVAAEQTVQRADRDIESAVKQAAIEAARQAVRERDKQVDMLAAKRVE